MDNHTNLRGKSDKLKYYRLVESGEFIEKTRIVEIMSEFRTKTYYYPEQNKIIYDEDEIRKFSLDKYGESIPFLEGEYVLFNNYLFDFWGYYLGAEGVALYGHLRRYAYGNKDFCYPNFSSIEAKMDKTRNTIKTYLEILERYGFTYKFGVLNESNKMFEESPLFKLRKTTPLLGKKLIYGDPEIVIQDDAPPHIKKVLKKEQKGLPAKLREEHEKFVEKYMQQDKDKLETTTDYEAIYNQWQKYGKLLENAKKAKQKTTTKLAARLNKEMNEHEELLLNLLLEKVQAKVSKPSFDTWFKELLLKVEKTNITLYTPNEFAMDWISKKYIDMIQTIFHSASIEFEQIQVDTYNKNE